MFEFIDKIHILFFPTFKNTCGIRRHKAWNHVLSRRDNKYGISENSNTEKMTNVFFPEIELRAEQSLVDLEN